MEESRERGFEELVDGPVIELLNPEDYGTYESTFPVLVVFSARPEGFEVDMTSLKVTYRKLFGIAITERLREYIGDREVRVPEVKLPPGKHRFQVYIEDIEDRRMRS